MAERALVTGATSGIGPAFARRLAASGCDLVLAARSIERLEAIAAELRGAHGIAVDVQPCDLSRRQSSAVLHARAPACDILINNAGFANNGSFAGLDEAAIGEELQLDVVTLTELTRLYLPGMLARGRGRVLNVASTAGFIPGPNMAVYYAAKAYVISFSQAIAEELRGSGVTVTVLCPGATRTGFQSRAKMERTPLFRMPAASADDVARAGLAAMRAGRVLAIPGITNKIAAALPRFAPRALVTRVSGALVKRPAGTA